MHRHVRKHRGTYLVVGLIVILLLFWSKIKAMFTSSPTATSSSGSMNVLSMAGAAIAGLFSGAASSGTSAAAGPGVTGQAQSMGPSAYPNSVGISPGTTAQDLQNATTLAGNSGFGWF